MKILVDGTSVTGRMNGTKRTLFYVLNELVGLDFTVSIVVVNSKFFDDYPYKNFSKIELIESPTNNLLVNFLFVLPLQVLSNNYDIYWSNNHRLPIFFGKKPKLMLTIHDFTHVFHPETMKVSSLLIHRLFFNSSVTKADGILFHSSSVESEANKILSVREKKIISLLPMHDLMTTNQSVDVKTSSTKYFLFISTIEPRKNLMALIKAYTRLPKLLRDEYSLVIAGDFGWNCVEELNFLTKLPFPSIIFEKNPSDNKLRDLIEKSSVLTFPSIYEGLGLPLLEALLQGKVICCSDIAAFRSIAGPAAIYFNPNSVESIRNALEKSVNYKTSLQKKGQINEQLVYLEGLNQSQKTKLGSNLLNLIR